MKTRFTLIICISVVSITAHAQSPSRTPEGATQTTQAPQTRRTNTQPNTRPHSVFGMINNTSPAPERMPQRTAAASGETSSADNEQIIELRAQVGSARNDAERAVAQRALVDALIGADRQTDARAELGMMSLEDRFDPIYFYNIGNAFVRLDDLNGAVTAYRKAIDQRRGNYARALNNLGVVLLRQARWDEAHEAFTSALRQESFTYAEASYNLGRLYVLRGEAGLAIREWQRTLRIDRNHADAAIALARLYVEDGDPQRANAVLSSFTARDEVTRAHIAEARGAIGTIEVERSPTSSIMAVARRVIRNPFAGTTRTRPVAVDQATYELLQRARSAREGERYEEAITLYRRVLAYDANFAPALLELSFAQMSLRQHAEAISTLETLVRREPTRYPVAFYHLGRLYELRGELNTAATNFARAAELYGDTSPQPLVDVSRVRERQGDARGALEAMEAYVAASARLGYSPEWAAQRLTELRARAAVAPSTTQR